MLSSGEPTETVRYVQVRPPEIVGPAPEPGAAAAAPPPIVAEAPPAPVVTEATPQPPAEPGASPPPPSPPSPPAAPAPPPPPAAPVQEPVVAAAGRVEPSVVLLQTSEGQGSGIIYDSGGLVLTAAHVVEGAEPLDDLFGPDGDAAQGGPRGEDLDIDPSDGPDSLDIPEASGGDNEDVPDVVVQLANGVRTGGRVLAANRELDVAVVQIDPTLNLTVAEIGSLSTVEVGQTAVAVGSPFGMENIVTVGVVSAVNQVLGGAGMPPLGMIQTDAPINFGNSGGALADLQGRVIGMNVAIQSTVGGGNIGVGFATPIEVAIWIAEELRAGRDVRFGFLGITGYTPPLGEPGAIVASITPGGPADAAGMEVNDRIVTFDGQPVSSMDELAVAVRLRAPGSEVAVEVVRGDLLIRLFIPLGDRGASLDAEVEPGEGDADPEVDP
jgi:S1-C subfamily serine protease